MKTRIRAARECFIAEADEGEILMSAGVGARAK